MPKASDTPGSQKLLVICGPTATGKTKLAIWLAKKFNGELISADSRQIYIGLDVLTGKDLPPGVRPVPARSVPYRGETYDLTTYTMDGIRLWLYDAVIPDHTFSVSLYRVLALTAVDDIISRGKLPIIVGGTGLYIESLIYPKDAYDIPPDPEARSYWNTLTVGELQAELSKINPSRLAAMNNSDRNNPRRLIRALEVTRSHVHAKHSQTEKNMDVLWIGLRRSITELKKRITRRVLDRWDGGALTEVRQFMHIHPMMPAASTLGRVPVEAYVGGQLTKSEAIALWTKDELDYAKRQLTWFKHVPYIRWFDAGERLLPLAVEKEVRGWYTVATNQDADQGGNIS